MTNGWYINRQNGTAGPFSGAQLKELAASGRLHAEDRVRRGQDGKTVLANRIKGLFTRDDVNERLFAPAVARQPRKPGSNGALKGLAAQQEHLARRPRITTLLLVSCLPVVLYLIWPNPRSSQKASAITAGDSSANESALGEPVELDALGIEDLIDNPAKYAGKVLILEATWQGSSSLRSAGRGRNGGIVSADNSVVPFEIGGQYIRTFGRSRHTAFRTIKVRISSADVHAEFESVSELPDVGGSENVEI